jgi:hypothetical protein
VPKAGQRLSSLITTASLLVHVIGGCCWHHGHALARESCEAQGERLGCSCAAAGCCKAHKKLAAANLLARSGEQRAEGPAPSPARKCEHVRCITVLNPAMEMPETLPLGYLFSVGEPTPRLVAWVADEPLFGPPLRPHLLLQVLLI